MHNIVESLRKRAVSDDGKDLGNALTLICEALSILLEDTIAVDISCRLTIGDIEALIAGNEMNAEILQVIVNQITEVSEENARLRAIIGL